MRFAGFTDLTVNRWSRWYLSCWTLAFHASEGKLFGCWGLGFAHRRVKEKLQFTWWMSLTAHSCPFEPRRTIWSSSIKIKFRIKQTAMSRDCILGGAVGFCINS